jgi:hypothetical protein
MQFNWAERVCRWFASDEIKALINKLDTDDEFRKNYFEGAGDSRTVTANYILLRKDTTYQLSTWDYYYSRYAMSRIRSEYKIRKTKDAILHIVMDTLEDKTTPPPAQSPTTTSYTSPLGSLFGGGSSISNTALQALSQQYTASQQLLNQQLGQKFYL